ncbi:MAG: glutamine-hydrolyzing carbamoyl-phosphate synthase small subunit [Gammaproteobacteria bacterium]|nr:glutamine-hydrolyzing carbamoyl-phosphate synthase small subunit [Gammaproteobacteria bacterium]
MSKPAHLALVDGQVFEGQSLGALGQTCGELIFNTAMTGYQEILTDPSYAHQIITYTYPHIGNVGVNSTDQESDRVFAKGLVIRSESPCYSNWRAESSLSDFLIRHKVIGIKEIDTRALVHILREKGAQNACIVSGDKIDVRAAVSAAKACPSLKGLDLAQSVTTKKPYEWTEGKNPKSLKYHVVAYDYGIKRSILRILNARGCRVTVVPAQMPARDALAYHPHGIFLSNGPGDPAASPYAIEAIRHFLELGLPIFGICLGFQLLALACGAKTIKMKYGHHGANHPVSCVPGSSVMITSQNHGFAVDESTLPACLSVTHRSLFDNTLQGIQHGDKPAFGFQGHPEASPGPHDVLNIFDAFISAMEEYAK